VADVNKCIDKKKVENKKRERHGAFGRLFLIHKLEVNWFTGA